MDTPIKIYLGPLSMFSFKVEIATHEKGVPVDIEFVPFSLARFYEPRHPDVARVNPKNQVPILIHGDLELYDSTLILEYLEDVAPEPALWPSGAASRARARLLELECDEILFAAINDIIRQRRSGGADPDLIAAAASTIQGFYRRMDAHLAGRNHLVDRLSFADIALFACQLFGNFMQQAIPPELAHLLRWRERMAERPSVRTALQRIGEDARRLGAAALLAPAPSGD